MDENLTGGESAEDEVEGHAKAGRLGANDMPGDEGDDDVEGHGRFGLFLDADSTTDYPYPSRPSGAPER